MDHLWWILIVMAILWRLVKLVFGRMDMRQSKTFSDVQEEAMRAALEQKARMDKVIQEYEQTKRTKLK